MCNKQCIDDTFNLRVPLDLLGLIWMGLIGGGHQKPESIHRGAKPEAPQALLLQSHFPSHHRGANAD